MSWDDDKEDDLTEAIKAAHPIRSGSHATYNRAMELVGNRRSKAALVELVNYFLVRQAALEEALRAVRPHDSAHDSLCRQYAGYGYCDCLQGEKRTIIDKVLKGSE